jgi:hypothetical protein
MHHVFRLIHLICASATFWTAFGAIVVAFYTYYARKQWIATSASLVEARRSADAAQEALKVSRDELRISVRPWVAITDEVGGVETTALKFDGQGNATMQHSITVRNFSESAAQNVMAVAFLMVTEDLNAIKARQKEASSDNYVGKTDMGFLLLPGRERLAVTSASRFERSQVVSKSYTDRFQAYLVGCIGYRDQFGFLYHTNFIYWMVDPATQLPLEFNATANSEIRGLFVPWHTSID